MGAILDVHRRKLGQLAATQAAAPASLRSGAAASEYQLQLVRLGVDLRRLKEIQSVERKIELKRELIPGYMGWVEGVLAADTDAPDEIVTHMMIWLIDVGACDAALPIARHVIRHHLTLPERFDRTAPTLIAEEIAESALKRLGQDPAFGDGDALAMPRILRTLDKVEELVAGEDIFDQVRAKLEKAIGLAQSRAADALAADADGPAGARRAYQEQAIRRLARALELDPGAGVKQRLDKLRREAGKAAAA